MTDLPGKLPDELPNNPPNGDLTDLSPAAVTVGFFARTMGNIAPASMPSLRAAQPTRPWLITVT